MRGEREPLAPQRLVGGHADKRREGTSTAGTELPPTPRAIFASLLARTLQVAFLIHLRQLPQTLLQLSGRRLPRPWHALMPGQVFWPVGSLHSRHVCLLDVLAHFRTAGAAAARRTIAQELLSSPSAIDLADVNISVGVDSYHVRPVKLARLAAAPSKAT